jgi:hypothetical protein
MYTVWCGDSSRSISSSAGFGPENHPLPPLPVKVRLTGRSLTPWVLVDIDAVAALLAELLETYGTRPECC